MGEEFEKYWKSSRPIDTHCAETNAQILDKMIAKAHFLAGAAAMKEKAAEVANLCASRRKSARFACDAIRKLEVE